MWEDMMRGLLSEDSADTKSAVKTVDGEAVGSPVRNVDADTLAISDKRYRLEGFNAPETAKFQGGVFVPNQEAGNRTQDNVNRAANAGGYTNLVDTGKRDPYKRIIGRQENQAGHSLGDALVATGIVDPNIYSSIDAVGEQGVVKALSRIMPSMADADPMIRIAREEHERKVKESGGNPLYVPKIEMADEGQYAAAKTMVGTAAVKQQIEEIERLEDILKDPDIKHTTRENLNKQLEEAKDKLFFAGTTPDLAGSVAIRKGDRNIMNQAHAQFSTSFDKAMLDMKKGFYGYLQIAGEGNQWDWLAKKGQEGVLASKVVSGSLPDTLGSIRDIRTGGDSWDTITDAATYASNLVAGTLPMMGVLIGSTMAAGAMLPTAAVAAAASTLPAAVLYSGQFYADQPDDKKNSALALSAGIGAATLDRLGLDKLIKGGNIFSAVGREEVIGALQTAGRAATREEAEALLRDASKKTIIEMSTAGADFAAKHYASKEAGLAAIRAVGTGTAAESVTETGQTLLEMFAVSGELDPDLRYEKNFYNGLIDAAIGGGLMGGTIAAGGTAIEMAQWGSAANALKKYEGDLNDAQAFQAQQKALAETGVAPGSPQGVTSVLDAISKVNSIPETGVVPGLMEMTGRPGYWNGFLSIVKDPIRLVRGLADTTVRDMRKQNGELKFYSNILKSIMKPGILPGDSVDGFRQRIIGEFHTPDAETLATELKVPVRQANSLLRNAWQNAWSNGARLTGTDPQSLSMQAWKDKVDAVNKQGVQLLGELGYDTTNMGSLDAVFVDAAIDPKVVAKNESRVIDTMTRNGASVRKARETVADLLSGNANSMAAAKEDLVRHGVFRDPNLNDLFEPNIFAALENYKHRLATQASSDIYLGKDGALLAKLIQKAKENGEFKSEAEYNDTVQNVQDFYKIMQGNYNTLENYPFIEKMVGWGVTVTMLASLGKATLSSLPEIAMATMGTSGNKVHEQLGMSVKAFMEELRSEINKGVSFSTAGLGLAYARNTPNGRAQVELKKLVSEYEDLAARNATAAEQEEHAKKVKKFYKKYMGRSLFEKLGYNDSGYNTQAKFETDSANMKKTMQVFASMIGLNAVTNATRIATLSMASDIVLGRLTELQAIPIEERSTALNTGVGLNNVQYQALKEMQSWGMDVEKVLGILDSLRGVPNAFELIEQELSVGSTQRPTQADGRLDMNNPMQQLKDELMTSLRNMVDQRVTNPQKANLPKYYHDPRLRVFTAMTRFIASLTANILPRLYRDYIKDGSTGMRYQAFTTMAMALTFAYMANMLKDILAYGDDENPYLKGNVKAAQRALYGSGLLGRGEVLVDTVMPLYNSRKVDPSEAPFTYAYQSLRDAAPPIGWSDRAVRAMYDFSSGNTEAGVKKAVRSLPLVGSFPVVADTTSKQFKE